MNGCLLCRRGWEFFFVEITKKAFSIVFFLGVSNASDPVKPSSKRRKHRARTSRRSNNNNSTSNNNSVENSIMFLEKFTGQCKCGNVRFSGRKLFYSFACHCDACRNAYEKQGKGFATPILGLKMFTTVKCEKENSIETQTYETKSSTIFGGVNRMKCKSCETYFGSRGFGLYWVFEFMNQSLCADAKEDEIVADFYLSDSKRNELSLPTRPHFSNDWMCTAMFVVYFLKSVFFDSVQDVLSVAFAENIREEAPCILL